MNRWIHDEWIARAVRWTDAEIVARLDRAHDSTAFAPVPDDEYHYLYQEAGNRHIPIPTTYRR